MPNTTNPQIAPPPEPRRVCVNEPGAAHPFHKKFKGNRVSTTKYNLLTYFPKATYEQYRQARFVIQVTLLSLSFPGEDKLYGVGFAATGEWPTSTSRWWLPYQPRPSVL